MIFNPFGGNDGDLYYTQAPAGYSYYYNLYKMFLVYCWLPFDVPQLISFGFSLPSIVGLVNTWEESVVCFRAFASTSFKT